MRAERSLARGACSGQCSSIPTNVDGLKSVRRPVETVADPVDVEEGKLLTIIMGLPIRLQHS